MARIVNDRKHLHSRLVLLSIESPSLEFITSIFISIITLDLYEHVLQRNFWIFCLLVLMLFRYALIRLNGPLGMKIRNLSFSQKFRLLTFQCKVFLNIFTDGLRRHNTFSTPFRLFFAMFLIFFLIFQMTP